MAGSSRRTGGRRNRGSSPSRRWLPPTGLVAGHSGRLEFGNPPLQPLNHPLLFQNGGLQLGDDGDEDIAGGGGQVNFGIHSLYMT